MANPHKKPVSAEVRAEVVALYRQHQSINRVAELQPGGLGKRTIHRVLKEEGVQFVRVFQPKPTRMVVSKSKAHPYREPSPDLVTYMQRLTSVDKAWIAAVIETRGACSRGRSGTWNSLTLNSPDSTIVDYLNATIPGSTYSKVVATVVELKNPSHRWRMHRQADILYILDTIIPYFRTSRKRFFELVRDELRDVLDEG